MSKICCLAQVGIACQCRTCWSSVTQTSLVGLQKLGRFLTQKYANPSSLKECSFLVLLNLVWNSASWQKLTPVFLLSSVTGIGNWNSRWVDWWACMGQLMWTERVYVQSKYHASWGGCRSEFEDTMSHALHPAEQWWQSVKQTRLSLAKKLSSSKGVSIFVLRKSRIRLCRVITGRRGRRGNNCCWNNQGHLDTQENQG